MRFGLFLCSGLALATAGCGEGAGSGAGNGSSTGGAAIESVTARGASWAATDACKVLSKDDLARSIGEPVSAAKLDTVVDNKDAGVAFSTCFYTLKDGNQVALLTRKSESPDNTPAAIARTKQETVTMLGPVEDVSGVGTAAFWTPKLRQLVVFVGPDRYFNLTMPATIGGKDPKTLALSIASELD